MVEWWSRAHDLLIESGINRSVYPSAVREANIALREGTDELVRLASAHGLTELRRFLKAGALLIRGFRSFLSIYFLLGIELLVFSAGLKAIIEEVFRQQLPAALGHARIVANEMLHDADGKLVAFGPDLLHTFNKKYAAVSKRIGSVGELDRFKKCVLLLGDNVSDVRMADGYECESVLTIGFLNHADIDSHRSRYLAAFDIVLTHDASLDFVLEILRHMA
eukprot:m.196489 g.196489  ORF g.196489 m.196489 type:complete len:221 (+) comp53746_c0_seq13:542-1204(+)